MPCIWKTLVVFNSQVFELRTFMMMLDQSGGLSMSGEGLSQDLAAAVSQKAADALKPCATLRLLFRNHTPRQSIPNGI